METHLPNKCFHVHHVTVLWDGLTSTNQLDLVHSIYTQLWSSWKAWGKSVVKVFQYNCLCSQTAASASESNDSIYCVSSARSEVYQVHYIIYENYYIQWLLIYS